MESEIFESIGREAGCRRLSKTFYEGVAKDAALKPLFPGKSLRCASEEFSAFLIQFFGGDENQTQYRWWLSLRQSHARFKVDEGQRLAWLGQMERALEKVMGAQTPRAEMLQFFTAVSGYALGGDGSRPEHPELAALWERQLRLEQLVQAIRLNQGPVSLRDVEAFRDRPGVIICILADLIDSGQVVNLELVMKCLDRNPGLIQHRYNGRTLLHLAAGAGCHPVVKKLLDLGMDANVLDSGLHTPLYRAAGCPRQSAAEVIATLASAGADLDHCGGISHATALHQAARFGTVDAAKALVTLGARLDLRDRKGKSPYERALRCRQPEVAALLLEASRSGIL